MLKLRHSILNFVADLHLSVRLSDRAAVQGVAKKYPPKISGSPQRLRNLKYNFTRVKITVVWRRTGHTSQTSVGYACGMQNERCVGWG